MLVTVPLTQITHRLCSPQPYNFLNNTGAGISQGCQVADHYSARSSNSRKMSWPLPAQLPLLLGCPLSTPVSDETYDPLTTVTFPVVDFKIISLLVVMSNYQQSSLTPLNRHSLKVYNSLGCTHHSPFHNASLVITGLPSKQLPGFSQSNYAAGNCITRPSFSVGPPWPSLALTSDKWGSTYRSLILANSVNHSKRRLSLTKVEQRKA